MPRLITRGLSVEQVCRISEPLIQQLAVICGCEEDNFALECISGTNISKGVIVEAYPFVEVTWFERGTAIRNQFAEAVTRHVLGLGVSEIEVAFTSYPRECYYINGAPCE